MRTKFRTWAAPVLGLVRRGRIVAWTPEWMGFGNVLLLAQWAHEASQVGERHWILANSRLEPWLSVFPHLGDLVLTRDQVRFTDQRVMPWSATARAAGARGTRPPHQARDIFATEEFVAHVLLRDSEWVEEGRRTVDPDHLVVNVRRGDYYSDPEIRAQYGFDVASYLRVAVDGSVAQDGVPSAIIVVSDDIAWCRSELVWLEEISAVTWAAHISPVDDFQTVSSARRSVITNSTFSYWAAHVSNVVHGDNHGQVWVPRFFDRTQNGGCSWLLDERWSVVENIPGGWDC